MSHENRNHLRHKNKCAMHSDQLHTLVLAGLCETERGMQNGRKVTYSNIQKQHILKIKDVKQKLKVPHPNMGYL